MPSEEIGIFITDPQEKERITSTLLQMLREGRDEAEVERWVTTNIPDEIQQELTSIEAVTIILDEMLPQLEASGELEPRRAEIERWQAEVRQRLDDIKASLEKAKTPASSTFK